MMKMKLIQNPLFLAFSFFSLLVSCEEKETTVDEPNEADAVIAEVRSKFAPDKRVALLDVDAIERGGTFVLKGESNIPQAVEELKNKLNASKIVFKDSIRLLPSEDLQGKTLALVKNSVANLRSNPAHSAELATQATLGTPLNVLKKEDNWYLVQSPDKYLAWVDSGGITLMTKEELSIWKAAEKVIFTEPYGQSYSEANKSSQSVSDLVAGNILELKGAQNGFFEVLYPDGRTAFVPQENAKPYKEWLNSLEQTEQDLVATSKKLMGAPYLWGGTSPKGVDCSGFTKTVYFLNGTVIPRDASQQIHTGKLIDSVKNFTNHRPGDLLFFGRKATDTTSERVIHVGMWIGDNKFIHSMGDVHISNFDTTATDFDEYNYNRYLRTKRLLGQEGEEKIIQLAESDLFTETE